MFPRFWSLSSTSFSLKLIFYWLSSDVLIGWWFTCAPHFCFCIGLCFFFKKGNKTILFKKALFPSWLRSVGIIEEGSSSSRALTFVRLWLFSSLIINLRCSLDRLLSNSLSGTRVWLPEILVYHCFISTVTRLVCDGKEWGGGARSRRPFFIVKPSWRLAVLCRFMVLQPAVVVSECSWSFSPPAVTHLINFSFFLMKWA